MAVAAKAAPGKKPKLSVKEAVIFLSKSPQMQCLAVMALAQGLSTNLIEIAWKSHLHMLHPSPAAYSVSSRLTLRNFWHIVCYVAVTHTFWAMLPAFEGI